MRNLSQCKASVRATSANFFGELAANCLGVPRPTEFADNGLALARHPYE
jgi:hypothetical protein